MAFYGLLKSHAFWISLYSAFIVAGVAALEPAGAESEKLQGNAIILILLTEVPRYKDNPDPTNGGTEIYR